MTSFTFRLGNGIKRNSKKTKKEESDDEDVEETKSKSKKTKYDDDLPDNFTCGICIEIMYKPVTLIPCHHNVFLLLE